MACSYFYANGGSCNNCCHLVKSTSIELSGTTLTVTIPQMQFTNNCKLCVALCQSIPDGVTAATQVIIVSGNAKLTLLNKCGNYIYADQVRCRKVLNMLVATDTQFAVVMPWSKLCCTIHQFPTLNAPTTSTDSTVNSDSSTATASAASRAIVINPVDALSER